MPGAGTFVRAVGAGPGQNPGAAGPAGTGESRPLRAGTRVAGAVGNGRAAATHGGGTARHPAAAHRRAGADQSGGIAKVSDPSGGMALFNAFVNSKQSGGADYPVTAAPPL